MKCENCGTGTWIFEVEVFDEENQTEYYCNECLANIFTEDPTCVISVKRVEDTF